MSNAGFIPIMPPMDSSIKPDPYFDNLTAHIESSFMIAGLILGLLLAFAVVMWDSCRGTRVCAHYFFLVMLVTYIGCMLTGEILAYLYVPYLKYGKFIPPTCAARLPLEGPSAFPCELKRLWAWFIRFTQGLRGEQLGPWEHYWTVVLWRAGGVVVVLIPALLMAIRPELFAGKDYRQVSDKSNTEDDLEDHEESAMHETQRFHQP